MTSREECDALRNRDPVRMAAVDLLVRLEENCGPRPVWRAEMDLLRGALLVTREDR